MKHFIVVFLVLFINTAYAQEDTILTFIQVRTMDSMPKSVIYERVKIWSTSAFEKTSGTLQMDDRESGLLTYDATASASSPNAPKENKWKTTSYYHRYRLKIRIQVRDGKYRVEAFDVNYKNEIGEEHVLTSGKKAPFKYALASQKRLDNEWEDAKVTFNDFINKLFDSLFTVVTKKDNW